MPSQFLDKQNQGQILYNQQRFSEALKVFTSIIELWHDPSISVFDNRAACYIKLEDLPSALKDAREMITRDKASPSGYLRTGQVLQKMGEDKKAQGVYEYGLKYVPVEESERLRNMLANIRDKIEPPPRLNFLHVLPLELIEEVFSYLSFRSLVLLQKVSREWRDFLRNMPRLWRQLDFTTARKPITYSTLKMYIKRANGHTSHLTLYRMHNQLNLNDVLRYIVGACPNLQHLHVKDLFNQNYFLQILPMAKNLRSLVIQHASDSQFFRSILAACPRLAELDFHLTASHGLLTLGALKDGAEEVRPRCLRMLALKGGGTKYGYLIAFDTQFLGLMPNLEELSVQDASIPSSLEISFMTKLRKLDLDNVHTQLPFALPNSIQELRLGLCGDRALDDPTSTEKDLGVHHLLSLDLNIGSKYTIPMAENLVISNKATLRTLKLRMHEVNTLGTITTDFGPFPCLTSLSMQECLLDDERMIDIANHCPKLLNLDVTGNETVTGVGVKACVIRKTGTQIRSLNLTNCSGVKVDAVELARSLGVRVLYCFPSNGKQNRRARKNFARW